MIRVRQHGRDGELYDIQQFLPLLEAELHILSWKISVDWCSGGNCLVIEKSAAAPWSGTHQEFKDLYREIFQTIDGNFEVVAAEGQLNLLAFDSSYWEIESSIPNIEEAFAKQFGPYVGAFSEIDNANND